MKKNIKKKCEKKVYVKPTITRIALDNTISLVMMSHPHHPPHPPHPPKPPHPHGAFDSPFETPFN
jgi:hypothetical protein